MSDLSRRLTEHVADGTPQDVPPYDAVLARRTRKRKRRQTGLTAVAVVAVMAGSIGIGSQFGGSNDGAQPAGDGPSGTSPSAPNEPTQSVGAQVPQQPTPAKTVPDKPPPVQLLVDGATVNVDPWTYCWTSSCVDGRPGLGADLISVGSPESVDFWFAQDGWDFQATLVDLDDTTCPRQITMPAEKIGEQSFRVEPAGLAGHYRVDLFGRGNGGDIAASFLWATPTDGTMPVPDATMSLVAGDDGTLQTYGFELAVADLAKTPGDVQVFVTVTAANGESTTIDAKRQRGCYSEGTLSFTADETQTRHVLDLGPAPFTYDVALTLDGKKYTGEGVWPRDEKQDEAPYVDLTFTPPLPAL